MLQRMEAEVLFLDPDDLGPGTVALEGLGFDVEVLDWVDPYGPTKWIKARITTELDQNQFFEWAIAIVEPLRGDVVEAGLADARDVSVTQTQGGGDGAAII